jgi:hypothetical protein
MSNALLGDDTKKAARFDKIFYSSAAPGGRGEKAIGWILSALDRGDLFTVSVGVVDMEFPGAFNDAFQ